MNVSQSVIHYGLFQDQLLFLQRAFSDLLTANNPASPFKITPHFFVSICLTVFAFHLVFVICVQYMP